MSKVVTLSNSHADQRAKMCVSVSVCGGSEGLGVVGVVLRLVALFQCRPSKLRGGSGGQTLTDGETKRAKIMGRKL